ncbi:hypothetical protein DY023_14175 [Microbacterium bovistercoris]|uniref:Uncharacterized protein n=1 Tax=Microbacterium bovistercoris TaxID=2293570 RepID=A0A371NQV7_9MICO|nr:hypothetical protein [Microbacterium bovistercoris]REJ04584.1 hypothetical protein DY023_14175 [Microbacterium bovistercoris]
MTGILRRAHTFRAPASVPGVVVRIVLVAIVTAGAFALIPVPLWRWIAIVAALASVIAPRSMVAWVAAGCLPVGMLLTDPSPARTALAVLLVHAIHVLAGIGLTVPLRSQLALRALLPSARRFAVIELIAQPIAFGGALLVGGSTGVAIAWLAPLGAVLLLAGIVFALRGLRMADAAPGPGAGNRSGDTT